MISIGFYEARTHLSQLLDQAARGKKVLITRHGKPAAVLGPPTDGGNQGRAAGDRGDEGVAPGQHLGQGVVAP
jgi:prevent-host-death family protein